MNESATSKPWSRKQKLRESLNVARVSRHKSLEEEIDLITSESSDGNESFSLPRVEVLSDDDEFVDPEEFIPEDIYKEWISCQNKYTFKIIALILIEHALD